MQELSFPVMSYEVGELENLMVIDECVHKMTELLGPVSEWEWATLRRDTLAECVLDVVFSIRMRHSVVDGIIERWNAWASGRDMPMAKCASVLCDVHGVEGPASAELPEIPDGILPRNRVAGRLKTDVVADIAGKLSQEGIEDIADFREAVRRDCATVRHLWLGVKGLGVGSWNQLRLISGCDVVDVSPAVRRQLGCVSDAPIEEVEGVLNGVAQELGVSAVVAEYGLSMIANARKSVA